MAKLKTVWIWPSRGSADTLWTDERETDSLMRSSVRIAEAFSRELRARGVEADHSEVRLFVRMGDDPDIVVDVFTGRSEGFQSGSLHVPLRFHALPRAQRNAAVADALQMATGRLAEARGWNSPALEEAMNRVREADYAFRWEGPWKFAPGRSARVRLEAVILDDGYARIFARLERVKEGTGEVVGPVQGGSSSVSLERAAKSLRWAGPSVFAFWNGFDGHESLIAEIDIATGRKQVSVALPRPLTNDYDGEEPPRVLPRVRLV